MQFHADNLFHPILAKISVLRREGGLRIDALAFGPFYVAAIYAFWKGRDWIRNFALFWGGLMAANVSIILFEEMVGPYATPAPVIVGLANLPWLLFPFFVAARVWKEHPFTELVP